MTTLPPTPWKNEDWSDASFNEIAEYMAQYLPEDLSVEPTFENESFTVLVWQAGTIIFPRLDEFDVDALPAEQLKAAFEFVMKHCAQEAA